MGMKRRAVDRQGKEAKDFQSCRRAVWVTPQSLHLLAATLAPPGPSAGLCGGGCGDKRGTIPLGQAVSSLSQASWNRNDGCAERLKEMGWKWLLSNISKAGMLGREQVARTHIWKSFMAIICHHLKPRIISIITRRYT